MLSALQGVTAALYVAVAPLCAAVGVALARRRMADAASRRAVRLFAVFWLALAADALLGALELALVGAGFASAGLALGFSVVAFLAVSLMMWGLLHYLLFLFTGRPGWLWPLAAFYALAFATSVVLVASWEPTGLEPTRWGVEVDYAAQPTPAAGLFLSLAFLLPPILGALAYGSFLPRVGDATRRYRIALVSGGIFLWFATSVVLGARPLADDDAVQGIGRLVTLVSILAVAAAYFPPPFARRRWGIESLADEGGHAPRPGLDGPEEQKRKAARAAHLQNRVRDLI